MPSFDVQTFNEPVYKKILGLDGGTTVSNWYSLLGVEEFESDEAKIDQAMLRRFEQARRYQVGSYEDQALRLIDELGRAYACLTNDETRRSYDKTLGGQAASDSFAGAMEALLLNEVVETHLVPDETHVTHVDATEVEAASSPTPDNAKCPQCGKPTSPKTPVCYQCGHKKGVGTRTENNAWHQRRSWRVAARVGESRAFSTADAGPVAGNEGADQGAVSSARPLGRTQIRL
jgi:hypothetical protein